jgi:hypothetical protein
VKLNVKTEGLPQVAGVRYDGNAGGFISHVYAEDTSAFLKSADAIFRATPIISVSLDGLTAAAARELLAAGHLKHIRELSLNEDTEADALLALGKHRDAEGVRLLALWGTEEESLAQLSALAAGKHWSGLEELELLGFDEIDGESEAAADTLRRRQFRGLRRLEAWGNAWDDRVAVVAATELPELRNLDLAINRITSAGAAAISTSRTLKHLRALDLASCDMADDRANALIHTPNLPNLSVLRLDRNSGQVLSAKALTGPGRGPGLRVLTLENMQSSTAALEALGKCPSVQGLWWLTASNCGISDASLELLVRHLGCTHLTHLDLSDNELTGRGAVALAGWSGTARLQWLALNGNTLGTRGATALAASPYLKGLKSFSVSGRGVGILKKHFKKVFR